MFSLPQDVRYHSFYRDIPNDNYTWSRDWSAMVGFPSTIFPGETYVLENGHQIIRDSNTHWNYSIYISLGYIISIFALKSAMAQREKGFDLKSPLIAWNIFLALFSFLGAVRCLPEFYHVLVTKGFVASYTTNTYVEVSLQYFLFLYFFCCCFVYIEILLVARLVYNFHFPLEKSRMSQKLSCFIFKNNVSIKYTSQ